MVTVRLDMKKDCFFAEFSNLGVVKALREKELNGKYSPEDILSIGKNIYCVREHYYSKDTRLSEIPKKDQELLETLGVKLG